MSARLTSLLRRTSVLAARDRSLLIALFGAIIPAGPGFPQSGADVDHAAFFEAITTTTSPSFMPGLALMLVLVRGLVFVRHGRPFERLTEDERLAFVEGLAKDERYVVRQAATTLKMLACLAYFDDPRVRARFAEPSRGSR